MTDKTQMLIEISLQHKGEVIAERRTRFTAEQANRIYNLLSDLIENELQSSAGDTNDKP